MACFLSLFRDCPVVPPSTMRFSDLATLGTLFLSWLGDYERLENVAVLLTYVQIGCAFIGSLGATYNGILLIHLTLSLFVLIAIESRSQNLGRTYAVLFVCGILLDVVWFILFAHKIWNMSSEKYGQLFVFTLRVTLWMQIIGFSTRFFSSILWIQMYRLGISSINRCAYVESRCRNDFLDPPIDEAPVSNSILGGSIHDTTYFSSLLEDVQEGEYADEEEAQLSRHKRGSAYVAESSKDTT